ncbi:MAG: hypothetical protein D6702_04195 [Planctomycetota bacterium]|nr:MAG: hypothetical protein D6702_04195 [Planctomycetota bacterium]
MRLLFLAPVLALAAGPLVGQEEEPRTAADWNRVGLERLEAGDAEGAVEAFRAARERAPADEVVARNLARAYGHLGADLAAAGRLSEALAAFRAGSAVDRDGGDNEVLAARVLVRQGRRQEARAAVDRVRRDFPDNEAAVLLAADLRAVAGELDGAVEVLRAALPEDPGRGAALRRRLAQLEAEREAQRGFLTDRSAHFDLRYDPGRPELVAAVPRILEDLEQAWQRVARDYGLAPSDRVLVLVLDRERYRQGAPEWSAGLYDGRIRLAVGDYAAERERLLPAMRHEFVHAALSRLGPELPTWFQEGLAELVEDRSVAAARRLLAAGELPHASELAGGWSEWRDRDRVTRAYAYALSLCRFLAEEYGPTAFPLLFENLRRTGFDAAFRATFGQEPAVVDEAHRAAIRGG